MVPRSGRVDGGVDHARAALALGEPRAAPVRSGWAEATQRGRGNGGKVVRKRGRGMKICRVKYYVDFGGFLSKKEPTVRAAAVEPPRARRNCTDFVTRREGGRKGESGNLSELGL